MDKIRDVSIRVGLWLVSLLIADFCFSLFFGFYSRTISVAAPVFVFTPVFASPAWCLYLLVVIAFKDAEGRRIWTILSIGILAGPLTLLLWGAVDEVLGANTLRTGLWNYFQALPVSFLVFAAIVGSLTTCAYVFGLKILHRRGMHTP